MYNVKLRSFDSTILESAGEMKLWSTFFFCLRNILIHFGDCRVSFLRLINDSARNASICVCMVGYLTIQECRSLLLFCAGVLLYILFYSVLFRKKCEEVVCDAIRSSLFRVKNGSQYSMKNRISSSRHTKRARAALCLLMCVYSRIHSVRIDREKKNLLLLQIY